MFTLKRLIGVSLFVLILAGTALAQESPAPIDNPPQPVPAAPLVTATATAKRVRFVSPGSVVQLRLEVYNEAGQKLFDTELHGGNVLDWHLQDGAGQRLQTGSYACVLTIKSLSGRLSQRVGLVTVNDKKAAMEAAGGAQLSIAQQQTIGPVEANAAFTILKQSEAEALTAVTHDGTDGQLTSTTGALTFRTGDLFSGKDVERVRITPEGKVGIGTDKPAATLDVAGTIRATKGIEFTDGTVLTSTGQAGRLNANGEVTPAATGTGTMNRVAKWTDGAGTLGDTLISESNGSVVVGNAGQTGNIQIFGTAVQDVFAGMGPDINVGPAFNYGYAGSSFGRGAGFFNVRPDASAVAPNPSLRFMTVNQQRMIITNVGNVGISTSTPLAKLDILGGANADGGVDPKALAFQYWGGGYRHWIRTRHNATPGSGNAIDFFVNDSATAGGSTGPGLGSGSAHVMTLDGGKVGIGGVLTPAEALSVQGTIQSLFGGFKFPDATVQTTAAVNATYTNVNDTDLALTTNFPDETVILQLNLPAGTYLVTANSVFFNGANYFNANNSRLIMCRFTGEAEADGVEGYRHTVTIQGLTRVEMSFHSIVTVPAGVTDVRCRGFSWYGDLIAESRRLTAVKLSGAVIVQ